MTVAILPENAVMAAMIQTGAELTESKLAVEKEKLPLGTVGMDNGTNAGLLAAKILATSDFDVAKKLVQPKRHIVSLDLLIRLDWKGRLQSGQLKGPSGLLAS